MQHGLMEIRMINLQRAEFKDPDNQNGKMMQQVHPLD